MAIRAKADITISRIIDIQSVTRYYLLQSSTSASPSKPTAYPPASSWVTTEPSYTSGSTNTLYFVDCTEFTNGDFTYSEVSKSSSYEAAKAAYNKATAVETRVTSAETKISQNTESITLCATKTEVSNIQIGGRNYFSTRATKVFDENGEYALNDYQSKGSFTQFYNLTVPMSYFLSKKMIISFEAISPNGATDIMVYNNNGAPRYWMTFPNGNKASIDNSWAKIVIPFLVTDKGDDETYTESTSNKIEIYCPSQMGCIVRRVKVEVGTKCTDYTPAPEDMATVEDAGRAQEAADTAQETALEAESLIKQLADNISMLVTDGNGTSLMTQTEDGWVFSTFELRKGINAASESLEALTNSLGDTNSTVDVLQQAVDDLGVLTDYISIGTYEDQPCIELGETDSEFKLRITNTQVVYTEGSTVLAYFTNQSMHIKKAVIEEELQQGGFVWKVRSNGNMGLVWKGVSS